MVIVLVCPGCGGSGLRADELRRAGDALTAAEVEMLDSTRCRECCGDGWTDSADARQATEPPASAAAGADGFRL